MRETSAPPRPGEDPKLPKRSPMLIVALTGGIATGKTVVARRLQDRGCFVHDADRAAHALMAAKGQAWREIVSHFGQGILGPDRTIDRRKLGAIIFRDEQERRFLDDLIHPLVMDEVRRVAAAQAREGRTKVFVSEAALTIESGFAGFFDRVIVVWCQPEIQLRRLMERDGIDAENARHKIRSQMDIEDKKKRGHYLIDTSGSREDTERQTDSVYESLLGDLERKAARRA
jgi:dephospho-CoA kinase